MEFIKVTISLPKNLYNEGMHLINKGLFSNFSDLVRSGIRSEFKELSPVLDDFDDRILYSDKKLIKAVMKGRKEFALNKGKGLKNSKEIREYMERL